jgi:cytoskeletal protein RodZ
MPRKYHETVSDDTPTQRFEPPPAQPQPSPPDDERKSRLPLVLGIVGGVLLIAVIVLLVLLLGRSTSASDAGSTTSPTPTSTPSPTPTHTESASPTPTPTPTQSHTTAPPPAAGPAIQTFLVDNSTSPVVLCNTNSPNPTEIDLTFQWASTNVSRVYFGVDTNDASQGALFSNLPPSGTQADFPSGYNPYPYPCPTASEKYTLTVVGAGGAKVSRTITVLNKGDQ